MATITNKNLIEAIRRLNNLAILTDENREYFSDWFDYDVITTCVEVIKLLKPNELKKDE